MRYLSLILITSIVLHNTTYAWDMPAPVPVSKAVGTSLPEESPQNIKKKLKKQSVTSMGALFATFATAVGAVAIVGVGLKAFSSPAPVPNGPVPVPNGPVPVPNGSVPVPNGIVPVPNGIVPVPNGSVPVPNGIVPVPNGSVPVPVRVPGGNGGFSLASLGQVVNGRSTNGGNDGESFLNILEGAVNAVTSEVATQIPAFFVNVDNIRELAHLNVELAHLNGSVPRRVSGLNGDFGLASLRQGVNGRSTNGGNDGESFLNILEGAVNAVTSEVATQIPALLANLDNLMGSAQRPDGSAMNPNSAQTTFPFQTTTTLADAFAAPFREPKPLPIVKSNTGGSTVEEIVKTSENSDAPTPAAVPGTKPLETNAKTPPAQKSSNLSPAVDSKGSKNQEVQKNSPMEMSSPKLPKTNPGNSGDKKAFTKISREKKVKFLNLLEGKSDFAEIFRIMRAQKLPYNWFQTAPLPNASISWEGMKNKYLEKIRAMSINIQKTNPKTLHSFFVYKLVTGDISAPLLEDWVRSPNVSGNSHSELSKHLVTELPSYQGLERMLLSNDPIATLFQPQCDKDKKYCPSDFFSKKSAQAQQVIEVLAHIFYHKPNVGHARKLLRSIKATHSLDVRIEQNLKNLIDANTKAIPEVPKILGQPCFDDCVSPAPAPSMLAQGQPQNFSCNRKMAQMVGGHIGQLVPMPAITGVSPGLMRVWESAAKIGNQISLENTQALVGWSQPYVQNAAQFVFNGRNQAQAAVNSLGQQAGAYLLQVLQDALQQPRQRQGASNALILWPQGGQGFAVSIGENAQALVVRAQSFAEPYAQTGAQYFFDGKNLAQAFVNDLRQQVDAYLLQMLQQAWQQLRQRQGASVLQGGQVFPEFTGESAQALVVRAQSFFEPYVQTGAQLLFSGSNRAQALLKNLTQRVDEYVLRTFQQAFNHASKQSKSIDMNDWVEVDVQQPESEQPDTDLNKGKKLVISYIDEDYEGQETAAAKQGQLKETKEKQKGRAGIKKNLKLLAEAKERQNLLAMIQKKQKGRAGIKKNLKLLAKAKERQKCFAESMKNLQFSAEAKERQKCFAESMKNLQFSVEAMEKQKFLVVIEKSSAALESKNS